jgi:hypothetical protein
MGDRPSALALVESPDVFIEAMMADSLEGDGAAGIINFLSWNEQVISRSDKDELYERPVRIGSRRHSLREWLAIALWYSNDKPDAEDLPASEIVHVGWDDPEEGRAFLGELVEGRRMPRISQADLTRARVRLTRRQARRDEAKSRNAAELARIRERLAVRKDDLDLG